jgi:predicted small lipoprotein YifL
LEENMRTSIRAAAAALTLLTLGACGENRAPNAATPSSSEAPSPSDTAERSTASQGAADDPYNIAAGEWAVDIDGATEFYDDMPATFQGWKVKHPHYYGPSTGVEYGPVNTGITAWSMAADKAVPDAKAALAVMFGMGMACDKSTYRGTAEPERGGLIPGFGSDAKVDPWWFACEVAGAEGAPNYRAYAVGWTSGDLGWLTVTPDEQTSRELLEVMVERSPR